MRRIPLMVLFLIILALSSCARKEKGYSPVQITSRNRTYFITSYLPDGTILTANYKFISYGKGYYYGYNDAERFQDRNKTYYPMQSTWIEYREAKK